MLQFSSVLSCVQPFATPWTAACQASLSINYSQSLLKLMSIELVMPTNHLILCYPLLLLPSIFPSIRVFSKESDTTEQLKNNRRGFPGGASGKESVCHLGRHKRRGFDPWVGNFPWRRRWHPTLVFLPGKYHGQRSLADCSP